MQTDELNAVMERLAEPFDQNEVKWKPGSVSGSRALALAYVDARVVQDRLDEVLGVANWQDEYEVLADGSVVCRLKVRLGGEWITKTDVGGESEQPDGGDRRKASFSDALKRAAVKFGIGRYLYRLPQQWADFDPQKKKFVNTPKLHPAALPKPAPKPGADDLRQKALAILQPAAKKGTDALKLAWESVSLDMRKVCAKDLAGLKAEAAKVKEEASALAPA